MNISSHQIQNVIKAYGQRVERKRLSSIRPSIPQSVTDSITISPEAKNRQVADKIAAAIVSRATGQLPEGATIPDNAIFEKMGAELGGKIEVLADSKRKSFKFKVIDPEHGNVIKELDGEDFINRLYDRIESTVNKDMQK